MKTIQLLFFIQFFIVLAGPGLKAQAPGQCEYVMLQAFYWDSYSDSKWTALASKADEIAPLFRFVWLPPSGNCQSSFSMGYTPIWWFDQSSAFGTSEELSTLISELSSRGSKVIADVVVNQRSGSTSWTDFPTEVYNGVTYAMGPPQICCTDEVANEPGQPEPTGAPDTGEDFNGSRDLDHLSVIVRDNVKGYMQFLKNDIGYDGWRYDMVKGYSPSFINEYNTAANAYFSVGEYFDGNYDLVKEWIMGTNYASTAFDFPEKFALNSAMWSGGMNLSNLVWMMNGTTPQPAGLIHHTDTKRYAVTFVDNHDTYVTGNPNKFSGNIRAAYAFLMGSPGIPCVLLAHWNQYKSDIFNMVAARRAVRLHNESQVTVNQYSNNLYVSTATGLNGTLIVKIGSGSYTPPSEYTLAAYGTDYAMWTHATSPAGPLLMAVPSGGTYYAAQTITATASPGASIYYTTNNTPPNNNSTLYTSPIYVATTQTVRLIAYNPSTQLYSQEIANTYTIAPMPTSIMVRFKAPVGWTACKVYSWIGTTPLCGPWPGASMTLENDGYYTYHITGFSNLPVGVVFNNGATTGNQQTVDLFTATDKCWDAGPLLGGKYTAIEVTCPTVGTEEKPQTEWSIFPNPAHDVVLFNLPESYRFLSVISPLGIAPAIAPDYTAKTCRLDISGLSSGVYFITLINDAGKRLARPFVKY